MKKNKLLLPIYLALSLVLIICAVVMSLTVGVNLGVDFNGGKQVEIKLENGENTSKYESKINSVLDKYSYTVDSYITEDKATDTYYVFKINETDISDETATKIREDLAQKLEINIDNISNVMSISGNVTQKTIITLSIAVACVLLVFMLVGWARYGIMEGLTLLFVGLHNMIISFATLLITTLQINIPTVIAILVCTVFSVVIYTYMLERVRETRKSTQGKDMSDDEIFALANSKSMSSVIIVVIALAIISIASAFSQMHFINLFAISLMLCAIVAIYTSNLVGEKLGSFLASIKSTSDKQALSKNVEQKTTKKKTK